MDLSAKKKKDQIMKEMKEEIEKSMNELRVEIKEAESDDDKATIFNEAFVSLVNSTKVFLKTQENCYETAEKIVTSLGEKFKLFLNSCNFLLDSPGDIITTDEYTMLVPDDDDATNINHPNNDDDFQPNIWMLTGNEKGDDKNKLQTLDQALYEFENFNGDYQDTMVTPKNHHDHGYIHQR